MDFKTRLSLFFESNRFTRLAPSVAGSIFYHFFYPINHIPRFVKWILPKVFIKICCCYKVIFAGTVIIHSIVS